MPRKPKPSETVIRQTLDLALLHGKENLAVIHRSLALRLERLRQEDGLAEETPDVRTIKWIVNDYINQLPASVVRASFPIHVWTLRRDYDEIAQSYWPGEDKNEAEIMTLCRHFDDISKVARDWRDQILAPAFQLVGLFPCINDIRNESLSLVPTSQGTFEVRLRVETDKLFDSLRQHLTDSPVWELYEVWKGTISEMVSIFEKMCDFVRDSEELANEEHIRQGDWDRGASGITKQFVKAIVGNGCAVCTGEIPIWGELWRIAASKSHYDEVNHYQKISIDARQRLLNAPLMEQFQVVKKEALETEKELRSLLRGIENMTGYPGRCDLCPV